MFALFEARKITRQAMKRSGKQFRKIQLFSYTKYTETQKLEAFPQDAKILDSKCRIYFH